MVEPIQQLHQALRPFRQRILRLYMERMMWYGLLLAAVLASLLAIVDLFTIWYLTPLGVLLVALAGVAGGMLYARFRTPSDLEIAFTLEQAAPLKERLSTALALDRPADGDAFRQLVIADASAALADYSPTVLFQRRFARLQKIALGCWLGALLLYFLPFLPLIYSPQARLEYQQMAQAAQVLEQLERNLAKLPEFKTDERANKLLAEIQQLREAMAQHRLPREEALQQMSALQEQLSQLQQEQMPLSDTDARADAAQEARQLLEQRTATEKAAAARAADKLAQGTTREQLTDEERAALDRQTHLEQAAEALEQGDVSGASEALAQAGNSLQDIPSVDQAQETQQHLAQAQAGMDNAWQSMNDPQPTQASTQGQQGNQQGQQGSQSGQQGNQSGQQGGQQVSQADVQQQNGQQNGNQPGPQGGQQQGTGTQPGADGEQGNSAGNQAGQSGSQGQGNASSNSQDGAPGTGAPGGTGNGVGHLGDSHHRPTAGYASDTLKGLLGQGSSLVIPGQGPYGVGGDGPSAIPYFDVFTDYQRRAEHALTMEDIPPEDRQWVRDYFDALNPENSH